VSDDAGVDERVAALEREVTELRRLLEAAQARPGRLPQRMTNTGGGMCDRCRAAVERGETAVCGCVLCGPKLTCSAFRTAVQAVIADSARSVYPAAGMSARM
jgi:hypothetical protein